MMRWLIGSSLKARRAVVAAAVVVMAIGIWQLRDAKHDVLPEFQPVTVNVQTEALGLSAEEVEQLITVPLEQDLLDGVAWLDKIRSQSVPGLSNVELIFEPGTDLYRARQVVQERISQAAGLPNVSKPPQMLQPSASASRVAMVSLTSKDMTPIQIGVLARWTIRPRILAVPGVSNVAIWGQRERQLQVQVDPQKLADKGVTLDQVISSTGNALWASPLTFLEANTPGTGGFIDTANQRLGIQHNQPITTPEELAQVSIDETSGTPLTLGDVATVIEDHQPLIGDAIVDEGNGTDAAGFMLVVEKLPYANTADVTKGVEEALDELRPALSGLNMDSSVFRPATYVDTSVDHLARSVAVGAVLMLLALLGLFFAWRAALVSFASIVLSFMIAALVLHLAGVTFNAMIFAGLVMAIGAVVADAVLNTENIKRRLREERAAAADGDGPSATKVIRSAALETGRTVLWATVIFALALVPLLFLDGLSGDKFFPPLAISCAVAVLASLFVATTFTPALSYLLLPRAGSERQSPAVEWVRRGYDRALTPFARTPIPALVTIGVVAVAAALVLPRFDNTSLLPSLKDSNLLVHWDGAFGTSLPEMDRITTRAAEELRTVPGVKDVGAHVGRAILGDQAVSANSAEMWVSVDPKADYDKTVAAVKQVVDGYPGLHHEVVTYSQDQMRRVLTGASNPVTVRVYGEDLGVLQGKAGEIQKVLSGIKGVHDAHVDTPPQEPTMEVEVDLAKAQKYGIKPGDVRRASEVMLSGLQVGSLFEQQKVFDVQVWSTPENRHSLTSVKNLLLDTPDGGHVRLGDVADVRVRPTLPSISHEDISRYIDIGADVRGRSVGAVTSDLRDKLGQVQFPLEYHATVLSDYTDQQNAQRRVLGFVIAAAIGTFLLLQAAFASWRLAIVTFLTLPIAAAGGVIAAWLDHGPITMAFVAGMLAVFAVAVRSAITLMSHYQQLRRQGEPFGLQTALRGARERMAPIVITSVTTALALSPAIFFGDIAGQEIVHPMAVVILGGLVTSTLVSLFILPALYLRFGPQHEPESLRLEAEPDETDRQLAGAVVG
jgi:CzcA family heavy metal efflux pump